jgi:hypothetical protein
MTAPQPHLGVVATSRNDDHGANLLERMQLFVDGFAEQAERFGVPTELLVVEWNPPRDREPLATALRWPGSRHFDPVIVTVPPSVHESLPNSARLPLFQMIAKNVGVRRSEAKYILATNIDILLTDELFTFIKDGLAPDTMYRVDRRDVEAHLERRPLPSPADCRRLDAVRVHRLHRTEYPHGSPVDRGPREGISPGDAGELAMKAWYRLTMPRLHTSGCGDFTLASREVWGALRGYVEWPIFSWHLDGLLLFHAYASGVEMVNLDPPLEAVHLEHSAGSGWTPAGAQRLWERLSAAGVPFLTTPEYRREARKILRQGRHVKPFNGPDWGLANIELPIERFSSDVRPARDGPA